MTQKVSENNPVVLIVPQPKSAEALPDENQQTTRADIIAKIKSFLIRATDPKWRDPLANLGVNATQAYLNRGEEPLKRETVRAVTQNAANDTVEGIAQSLLYSAIAQTVPHTKYITVPIETVFTTLGVVIDTAAAEENKKVSTALDRVSYVVITTGTVIIISSIAHAYLGAFAASLAGKGAISLANGGMTAVLLESNPFRQTPAIKPVAAI